MQRENGKYWIKLYHSARWEAIDYIDGKWQYPNRGTIELLSDLDLAHINDTKILPEEMEVVVKACDMCEVIGDTIGGICEKCDQQISDFNRKAYPHAQ